MQEEAINKFLERSNSGSLSATSVVQFDEAIHVRSDRKMVRLPVSEICYLESIKDYIKIYTSDKCIITKEPISSIQSRLANYQFVRIHRSYLDSIRKVRAYNNAFVAVLEKQLPYGRTFKELAITQMKNT